MISRAEGRRSPGSKTPELICARSSAAMVDDEVLTTSSCTRTLNEGKHRSHRHRQVEDGHRTSTRLLAGRNCSYVGHHEQKAYTYFRGEHRRTCVCVLVTQLRLRRYYRRDRAGSARRRT